MAKTFSLPPKRYLRRQHLPPFGVTSRYIPSLSDSFTCFSPGFAFRTFTSVRGMALTPFGGINSTLGVFSSYFYPQYPRMSKDFIVPSRTLNKEKALHLQGFSFFTR